MDSFFNIVSKFVQPTTFVVSKKERKKMKKSYPDSSQRARILEFVDSLEREVRDANRAKLTSHASSNLDHAFSQMRNFHLDPTKCAIAVDVDASLRHMTWNSKSIAK